MMSVNLKRLAHETAGATTKLLQKLDVPILSKEKCKQLYDEVTDLSVNMMCAG